MTIVTSTYRYKPPPRRKGRKLAKITGPVIVIAKGSRRPRGQAAAEVRKEKSYAHPAEGGRCAVKHERASAGQRRRPDGYASQR